MAIVLTPEAHAKATRRQQCAPIQGTYGDERRVAVQALRAAGVPEPLIDASIMAAGAYFQGQLGWNTQTTTNTWESRWRLGC